MRGRALGSALALLEEQGVDIGTVTLPGGRPVAHLVDPRSARGESDDTALDVDFDKFMIYKCAGGDLATGDRHLDIWPTARVGPWLALEILSLDGEAAGALYREISFGDDRYARVRKALGLPPLRR